MNFSSKMLFFLGYCHAVSVKTAHNDGTFCHLGSTRNKQTTLQHKFKSTQRHKLGDFEKYKMPQINKERKQRDKNFKNTKTTPKYPNQGKFGYFKERDNPLEMR